jgi:hypothetical protein
MKRISRKRSFLRHVGKVTMSVLSANLLLSPSQAVSN